MQHVNVENKKPDTKTYTLSECMQLKKIHQTKPVVRSINMYLRVKDNETKPEVIIVPCFHENKMQLDNQL